jgi:hypothetical protein
MLQDNIFHCPKITAMLLASEETFGKNTPFNSAWKFEAIIKRAKQPDSIMAQQRVHWIIDGIIFLVKARKVTSGECSLPGLTGQGRSSFGLLDTLLLKRDLSAAQLPWPHLFLVNIAPRLRLGAFPC